VVRFREGYRVYASVAELDAEMVRQGAVAVEGGDPSWARFYYRRAPVDPSLYGQTVAVGNRDDGWVVPNCWVVWGSELPAGAAPLPQVA